MPKKRVRVVTIAALLLSACLVMYAYWFNSQIEVIVAGGVSGAGDNAWVMPVVFESPSSLGRFLVRIQDVSYTTTYFQSAAAWREKKPNDDIRLPIALTHSPDGAKEWEEMKSGLLPVRDGSPPANIWVEVYRVRPYDGTPESKTLVISYTVLGIKRNIVWTHQP